MKNVMKDIRTYFILLLGVSVTWFIYQMIRYPLLPIKYQMPIIIIILLFALLLVGSQFKTHKKIQLTGKILIILYSVILLVINYTLFRTVDLFQNIVQSEDIDVVSVIVKEDSSYRYIEDLDGKIYSTLENKDEYIDETINEIQDLNKSQMNLKYYSGVEKLVYALLESQTVDCIIMNESYRSVIEQEYPDFTSQTRVIYSKEFVTEVAESNENINITSDTFSIFISGIDTYGSISTKSRSDVNMIVTVNPTTKQILLTSIPRDYYIPFHVLDGARDKLTHSGLYGVDETKDNVADYFDINIPFYVRVNFTSLIDIVDVIGGIEVDNPQDFLNFKKGTIHLNGEEALTFSRERYSFKAGDRERGRNQMRVITGIINKVISPSIIKNYMSLLDSLHSSFQTNLSDEQMISLIRMQIDDMASWSIETYSVDGTGDMLMSPIYGSKLYMMIPDDNTVKTAKEKISALYK